MQKMMGLLRRCVEDYDMIADGDKIAVGVSGGKDSLVLLMLLAKIREYINTPFELEAVTIDMGLGMDYSAIEKLCEDLEIAPEDLLERLGAAGFEYNRELNKFW